MNKKQLIKFIQESNKIEGITGIVRTVEVEAFNNFLKLSKIEIGNLDALVHVFQSDANLRINVGDNVFVGNYYPPPGGVRIKKELEEILNKVNRFVWTPFKTHIVYENLHPFTDGNGRSGRALWAWQMLKGDYEPRLDLGFLHAFYYQTLQEQRK